ncbi:uncharacterized protein LOC125505633 [Dendroctonus ponderosae]|uniref:uncharacterized protein LOC125505633 n=1 Tax=Dendroctonus ponderosae TaxID=77166 RepID=UPI002035E561|nr:uncharacterized protein LOC125505633 [Dendroctonus ponderosae]XP_048525766.1 uncharacterized protein LOC125505633 [Dendroctonus ponderosae]
MQEIKEELEQPIEQTDFEGALWNTQLQRGFRTGFRRKRSTIDQLFALRQLLVKGCEFNKTIHNLFMDFRQTYDSVERNQVWNAMAELSILRKLIQMRKLCMDGGRSKVQVGSELSEQFEIQNGVMQGDAFLPLLFKIVLERAIRRADIKTELLSTEGPKLILAYADDIDLIGNTILRLKEFNKIDGTSSKISLMINEENTKYVCVNRLGRRDRIGQNVSINMYNFERVERFKNLSATITVDNDITEEMKERIQATNRCLYSLNNLLKSKNLTRISKVKIYKSIIQGPGPEPIWTQNRNGTDRFFLDRN